MSSQKNTHDVNTKLNESSEHISLISTLPQAFFKSLTNYAVIIFDVNGTIIEYNEEARQIYGYTPEEILGRHTMNIFFPDVFLNKQTFPQFIDKIIKEKRYVYNGKQIRKNRETFPCHAYFSSVKNKNGSLAGFMEIVHDLTNFECIKHDIESLTLALTNSLNNYQELQEKKNILYAEREKAKEQAKTTQRECTELEATIKDLQDLLKWNAGTPTTNFHGIQPLQQRSPQLFNKLTAVYENLLEHYLDSLSLKNFSQREEIIALAERFGNQTCGPRDIIDIHLQAIANKSKKNSRRKHAYMVEGRLCVLELMGYLVDYYRRDRFCPAEKK